MKKERLEFHQINYVLLIAFTGGLMSLAGSCSTIKKNMDNNYRAKNGIEIPAKPEPKKTEVVKF